MVLGDQLWVDQLLDQAIPGKGRKVQNRVAKLFSHGAGNGNRRDLAATHQVVDKAYTFLSGLLDGRLGFFLGQQFLLDQTKG